jgi:hypothetical protein
MVHKVPQVLEEIQVVEVLKEFKVLQVLLVIPEQQVHPAL